MLNIVNIHLCRFLQIIVFFHLTCNFFVLQNDPHIFFKEIILIIDNSYFISYPFLSVHSENIKRSIIAFFISFVYFFLNKTNYFHGSERWIFFSKHQYSLLESKLEFSIFPCGTWYSAVLHQGNFSSWVYSGLQVIWCWRLNSKYFQKFFC